MTSHHTRTGNRRQITRHDWVRLLLLVELPDTLKVTRVVVQYGHVLVSKVKVGSADIFDLHQKVNGLLRLSIISYSFIKTSKNRNSVE